MAVPTPQLTTQPNPGPRLPSGPLAHYLAHPGATTARLVHHLTHIAAHLAVTVGPGLGGVCLAIAVTVAVVRLILARRMGEGALLVCVLAPPDVEPQGAATLWTNLVALLRPAWRRLLGGESFPT